MQELKASCSAQAALAESAEKYSLNNVQLEAELVQLAAQEEYFSVAVTAEQVWEVEKAWVRKYSCFHIQALLAGEECFLAGKRLINSGAPEQN